VYIPRRPLPAISSFTANMTTTSADTPVMLNWNVSGAIYNIISPQVGPVRGNMITVVLTNDDHLYAAFHEPDWARHEDRNGNRAVKYLENSEARRDKLIRNRISDAIVLTPFYNGRQEGGS